MAFFSTASEQDFLTRQIIINLVRGAGEKPRSIPAPSRFYVALYAKRCTGRTTIR